MLMLATLTRLDVVFSGDAGDEDAVAAGEVTGDVRVGEPRVPGQLEGGFGLACATALVFFGWTANCPTPPVRSPSCAEDEAARAMQRHAASAAELNV